MSELPIRGISSMATRLLLAELCDAYRQRGGIAFAFESVAGVDAVRRVEAGEPFDAVVLASDAIDRLIAARRVAAGSKTDVVRSDVAIAVRAGAPRPDIGSEDALRRTVLAAREIGYSTGPSGVALAELFERWGIAGRVGGRMLRAPAGTPVGELVASGEVELGFQQLSELTPVAGIEVLGTMPPGAEIVTTFSAGLCAASLHAAAVRAFLAFLGSPETEAVKRRHGMRPA